MCTGQMGQMTGQMGQMGQMHAQVGLRRAGAISNARGAAPGAPSDARRPHGRCAPAFRVPLWVIWGAISNVQRWNSPPTGNARPCEPRSCRGYSERAKPVSGRTLERPVTAWPVCTVVEGAAVGDLEGIFQCAQVKICSFRNARPGEPQACRGYCERTRRACGRALGHLATALPVCTGV